MHHEPLARGLAHWEHEGATSSTARVTHVAAGMTTERGARSAMRGQAQRIQEQHA
jgi:hypothetical protein